MHKFALLAGLLLCGCGQAVKPQVVATDAWCRATPAGAMAGGCFVTLTANSRDRLIDVKTTAADHAEIHTMTMEDGVMRMRRLADGLDLPKGQPVRLSPGHEHLMIIGPKSQLMPGGQVSLTLVFAHAPPISLTAPVKAAPMPGMAR